MSNDVAATTCPAVVYRVLPAPLRPAPRTTHVWLTAPLAWAGISLTLRPATVGAASTPAVPRDVALALDRRDAPGPEETTIELAPRAPLAARTRYELWAAAGGASPPRILSTFVTSEALDDAPPAWSAKLRIRPAIAADPRVVQLVEPRAPTVVLEGDLAADAGSPDDAILFGVWIAGASGAIDYARPPSTYLRQDLRARLVGPGGAVTLALALGSGSGDACSPVNFAFPAASTRVGVVALDLAGNRSAAAELTLPALPSSP
jgi:hypothetical protein